MLGDFDFRNLNSDVRQLMLAEIGLDVAADVLVPSEHFNEVGIVHYPSLLWTAAGEKNEAWLAQRLNEIGAFNKIDKRGRAVRRDQHIFFAQCEFNRFYIRGVCRYAAERPGYSVRIYRARASKNPRPHSEAKIGSRVVPIVVLQDLRTRLATEVEFGLPEINSGLSVELVSDDSSTI